MKTAWFEKKFRKYIREIIALTFSDIQMRKSFIFAILFLVIGLLANLLTPFLLKMIVEGLSSRNELPLLDLILLSYGVAWIASRVSYHIRAFFTYRIEQRLTFHLGVTVLSHLYGLSYRYFINQKPGALSNVIRRAQRDVPGIILGLFFHILPTLLEFLFVAAIVFVFYPYKYSAIIVTFLGAYFLYSLFSVKRTMELREAANSIDKEADGIITDWISNYEAIRVFGRSDLAIDVCKTELKKKENAEVAFVGRYSLLDMGQSLILGLGLSVFSYSAGQGVLAGTLNVGDFMLFNGYIVQLIIPVGVLGHVIQDLRKALLDMAGILEVLETPGEIKEAIRPKLIYGPINSVDFKNVTFQHGDRVILQDFSVSIERGETVFIVGETGAGKSTLAKLLLRLYDPHEGHVYINGVNIRDLSLASLSSLVCWVPQESYLLNDSLLNNISFVRSGATLQEVEEALDKALLLNFVKRLPDGLNTMVGDRGLKLSGGEKQRLGLARLFLKQPQICIFDESTSSLDRKTAELIQTNIDNFMPESIKVNITHHFSKSQRADRIIEIFPERTAEFTLS